MTRLRGVARARAGTIAFAEATIAVDGAEAGAGSDRGGFWLELPDGARVELDLQAARVVPVRQVRGRFEDLTIR